MFSGNLCSRRLQTTPAVINACYGVHEKAFWVYGVGFRFSVGVRLYFATSMGLWPLYWICSVVYIAFRGTSRASRFMCAVCGSGFWAGGFGLVLIIRIYLQKLGFGIFFFGGLGFSPALGFRIGSGGFFFERYIAQFLMHKGFLSCLSLLRLIVMGMHLLLERSGITGFRGYMGSRFI